MRVRLLVVRGKPQGKSFSFPRGEFVIGRGSECHLRPNSSWVSRQHCMLRITEATASILDLGSVNGTLLNGRRLVGEQPLAHGDQLQVGPLVLKVCLEGGSAEAALPGETAAHNLETAESARLRDLGSPPLPQPRAEQPARS
jgi:pSer/pThr/pTyr-binding forkhead associated (FHA) protein